MGSTTLPVDFDIFSPRLNKNPCTTIWRGTGRSADIRNAGQNTAWKRLMSLPITCAWAGQNPARSASASGKPVPVR